MSSGPHRRASSSARSGTYEQQPLIATSASSSSPSRHEEVLGGQQPSSSSSVSPPSLARPWDCPHCTFINEVEILRCAMCQRPRYVHHPVLLATVTPAEALPSNTGGGHGERGDGGVVLGRRRFDDEADEEEDEEGGGGFLQGVAGMSEGQSFLNGALSGALTGVFAFVGACAGAVAGALAGRAADSGFFRSAGLGAVAGAVVSVEALEASRSIWRSTRTASNSRPSLASRVEYYLGGMMQDPFSADEIIGPGGRVWQVDVDGMSYDELYEMFGPGRTASIGLSPASLARLPSHEVTVEKRDESAGESSGCAICLQDMVKGEMVRVLPNCAHAFHKDCVDKWLSQQGICPVCRDEIVV
ncbi:hypothetical protein CBR_g50130 [Chara braunii]|uniref:RING-type domain-containing protein n=1 Tax=Chara braunii TaxID=69332 RepID=A0A388M620_CHABU|nr:hypothetical protein CBR_g50130 [Chara braunii]|eukprot:GBG90037.1 hypothetical protein CBR_g50130 [Chara braunii]